MKFVTKLVGVSFSNETVDGKESRQDIIRRINLKELAFNRGIDIVHEKDNKFDSNARAVYYQGKQLGYLGAAMLKQIIKRTGNSDFEATGEINTIIGDRANKDMSLGVEVTINILE